MSADDSGSDISDDCAPYSSRSPVKRSNKYTSYVDPMRDSSDDEHTEAQSESDVQGSGSNDTLSDAGMLRPVESDTSVSSALSVGEETNPDPRLSFLGPKTRMISKAPWEEETGADEEAVSDTEAPADTVGLFGGKFKGKARSHSKTLERRFLGGGWGRASSDTRPSIDSSKRSMESSVVSYIQTPTSPRNGSFSDAIRNVSGRTMSSFSASSAASSGTSGVQSMFPGIRPRGGSNAGVQINAYHLDSRGPSPVSPSSPNTPNFVHPYANLDLLSAASGNDGAVSPSRSNSSATLTASTGSSYVTPSSTSSSATLPEQHEQSYNLKKEKHRPPHITVLPLSRGASHTSSAKSPSALSISFVPISPPPMSTTGDGVDVPSGMLVFPGSPACNLISLEQAQMKVRDRSRSITSNTSHFPISPRPKEVVHKKSKPVLGPVGGGFSSAIGGGSPAPQWSAEDARTRTVSVGNAPHGRARGYTVTSIASQSTASINIIPGTAIENVPEPRSAQPGTPMETAPPKQLKAKRSGFLKFFNKNGSGSGSGNPNISAPSAPFHVSHNGVDMPPVPKMPAQYQVPRVTSPPELGARKELPPVVVCSPVLTRTRSLERRQSVSDDSHTSIGDHHGRRQSRFNQHRSNTEPMEVEGDSRDPSFGGLRLRPVSSVFKGMPEDYLTGSPKVAANSRGSDDSRNGDNSGFEDSNVLSPSTPYFPQSARSCRTHVSTASSGSDAFSSSVDPRTPSSFGFPPGVPRTSTDSQSASIIASLREQLKASQQQVDELENQVQNLTTELEAAKCGKCGRQPESSIVGRPRALTGASCRAYN
ncbi:hypothetical protein BN14_01409 [Rhizoctonia solani AG-1 IB]|uniref:Uncharacterized protein n=1 Tax=Thanatephorus cucumeris (strain AG1-IB / isolate 7/3/14) TaxID=1108050 RepID=M5BKV7_THACB|nr:hypothetical protein BN14_01409 [Rhizoctonia solani AG-1 IB]